jgi:hypothetical protein
LIERSVSIANQTGNIFSYQESLKVKHPSGEESTFTDNFQIRYWSREQVMEALRNAGFILQEDVSDRFSSSGSSYYVMKKSE